jgi:hypothetical protein
MKKIVFIILLISSIAFSQSAENSKDQTSVHMAGGSYRNPYKLKNKPKGSPYLQEAFAAANVVNAPGKVFMRYNIFNDEFEFISPKGDTLVLDKIEDFNNISFPGLGKKYKLTPYTDRKNKLAYGYLIEVYEKGDLALFKKENINFVEEKPAKTSLEVTMPARYSKGGDVYYLKNKGVITEFPDGKKALVKTFPEKKAAIESFIKDNKVSFDEEADLIRIIDFLAAQ